MTIIIALKDRIYSDTISFEGERKRFDADKTGTLENGGIFAVTGILQFKSKFKEWFDSYFSGQEKVPKFPGGDNDHASSAVAVTKDGIFVADTSLEMITKADECPVILGCGREMAVAARDSVIDFLNGTGHPIYEEHLCRAAIRSVTKNHVYCGGEIRETIL